MAAMGEENYRSPVMWSHSWEEPQMERVLVVEDEPTLRADLIDYLAAKGFATDGAASVAETCARLDAQAFDAVILDIGLPDGDGFDLLSHIRGSGLTCGVLMLTSFGDPDFRVKGLDGGADAYLVKKATLREIEATLRSVLRRQPAHPLAERISGWSLDRVEWLLTAPNGAFAKLTSSEVKFVLALAESGGDVCPREQLARITSRSGVADERNLDALVRRLRRKIEEATGFETPIKVAYGSGYACSTTLRVVG